MNDNIKLTIYEVKLYLFFWVLGISLVRLADLTDLLFLAIPAGFLLAVACLPFVIWLILKVLPGRTS